MCYSAIAIANYFIQKALDEGEGITNLRLQKLLYFAHANYYKATQTKLFRDAIYAWEKGPVVLSVYELAKNYGKNPITERIALYTPQDGLYYPAVRLDDETVVRHLDRIWRILLDIDTQSLVAFSHQPDGAWYKTLRKNNVDPEKDQIPHDLQMDDEMIRTCGL